MLTFEWARDNRHKSKLADFVFQFCPPPGDTITSRFPTKREDWLLALEAAVTEATGITIESKQDIAKRLKRDGKTTKEISEQLETPERTVRRWVANIKCRPSVACDN